MYTYLADAKLYVRLSFDCHEIVTEWVELSAWFVGGLSKMVSLVR